MTLSRNRKTNRCSLFKYIPRLFWIFRSSISDRGMIYLHKSTGGFVFLFKFFHPPSISALGNFILNSNPWICGFSANALFGVTKVLSFRSASFHLILRPTKSALFSSSFPHASLLASPLLAPHPHFLYCGRFFRESHVLFSKQYRGYTPLIYQLGHDL